MKRRRISQTLFIVGFWVFGTTFLTLFSIYSIRGYLYFAGIDPDDIAHQMAEYWLGPSQFLEAFLFGSGFGMLFVLVNSLAGRFHWDRWSFTQVILAKSSLYIGGSLLLFAIIFQLVDALGFYPEDLLENDAAPWLPMMALIAVFLSINLIMLNYFVQSNKQMGELAVTSFLTGKYREPVIENRIFMFIDLRSSTSIAEQLGSVKYSSLIRDAFRDLNLVVRKYPVEIYQYVGDEVVLTAEWTDGAVGDMIDLYHAFCYRLGRRKIYYESRYGHAPFFKAGLHGGEVTTTEVGTLRRHIAFHGDVMNTTSRIQHLCNELGVSLLVSAGLVHGEPLRETVEIVPMGEFELTGKQERVDLISVRPVDRVIAGGRSAS